MGGWEERWMYRLMGEWVNRLMVKVEECLRVDGWMEEWLDV